MDFIKRNAGIIATLALVLAIGVAILFFGISPTTSTQDTDVVVEAITKRLQSQGIEVVGGTTPGTTNFTGLGLGDGKSDLYYETKAVVERCVDQNMIVAVHDNPFSTSASSSIVTVTKAGYGFYDARGNLSLATTSARANIGTTTSSTATTTPAASLTALMSGVHIGAADSVYRVPHINNLASVGTSTSPSETTNAFVRSGNNYYLATSAEATAVPVALGFVTKTGAGNLDAMGMFGSTSPKGIPVKQTEKLMFFLDDKVGKSGAGTYPNEGPNTSSGGILDGGNQFECVTYSVWESGFNF